MKETIVNKLIAILYKYKEVADSKTYFLINHDIVKSSYNN